MAELIQCMDQRFTYFDNKITSELQTEARNAAPECSSSRSSSTTTSISETGQGWPWVVGTMTCGGSQRS